jgi:hypothetical protein
MARAESKMSKGSARNRTLGAIHAGRRALRWDVETYRMYLDQLVGKRSASECTDEELARVLDDMRVRGFERKEGAPPAVPRERATQLSKARALWAELSAIGALRNPTDVAFCGYVERMTRKSRPEWCTPEQLSRVIEGLKAWVERERNAQIPDDKRPVE